MPNIPPSTFVRQKAATGGGGADGWVAPLETASDPGTAPNTLADGESRRWWDTANSKMYFLTNRGGTYYAVELGSF